MGSYLNVETRYEKDCFLNFHKDIIYEIDEMIDEKKDWLNSIKMELLAFALVDKKDLVGEDEDLLWKVINKVDDIFETIQDATREYDNLMKLKYMLDSDEVRIYCEATDTHLIKENEEFKEVDKETYDSYFKPFDEFQ